MCEKPRKMALFDILSLFLLLKILLGHIFIFVQRSTSRELNFKKWGPYVKIHIFDKVSGPKGDPLKVKNCSQRYQILHGDRAWFFMYPIWNKSLFLYLQFATNRMSIFKKMRPWELVENGSLIRHTLYIKTIQTTIKTVSVSDLFYTIRLVVFSWYTGRQIIPLEIHNNSKLLCWIKSRT